MEEYQRRWEDLQMDCLVKVFERVGMESLLLDVPFVCKSWHKASLNPSCWKQLIFPDFEPDSAWETYPFYQRFLEEYRVDENLFTETDLIKFVVNRSAGNAISVKFPGSCTVEAFEYVADVCHGLEILAIPTILLYDGRLNLDLIGRWTNLVMLSLGCCNKLEKILQVVGVHCKKFCKLILSRASTIGNDEALAIVNLVPQIKILSLNGARIDKDSVVILLKGCKNLLYFDARNCIGFKEDDEEIAQLGLNSRSMIFMCEGSKERIEFNFDWFNDNNLAAVLAEFIADDGADDGEANQEVDQEDEAV